MTVLRLIPSDKGLSEMLFCHRFYATQTGTGLVGEGNDNGLKQLFVPLLRSARVFNGKADGIVVWFVSKRPIGLRWRCSRCGRVSCVYAQRFPRIPNMCSVREIYVVWFLSVVIAREWNDCALRDNDWYVDKVLIEFEFCAQAAAHVCIETLHYTFQITTQNTIKLTWKRWIGRNTLEWFK